MLTENSARRIKKAVPVVFVVAKTGDIMTMPGLGKVPAAEEMRVYPDGTIEGLS